MTEILTEPVSAPSVWSGDELADIGRWVIHFTEEDLADFERALAHIAGKHVGDVTEIKAEEFKDLGRRGPYERAYATNEDLGFHTDSTDFVGLMCLRPALHGGESFVASSGLLYNFVVGEHPEYLPILHKNFPTDWRSEEPPGSPGWYLEPLYSYFGGALSATVRTGRARSAMRFPEVPRLTADEVSCLTYFDSLPKRPGVALGMRLQTGDLQFVNNFVTVHTRAAFVDDAEDPARQRHLLRLWISRPEAGLPLCPE